jgi:DNA-binding NtrC family response regulator
MTGGIMARVLLVGYIPELLLERERTLRSAGYEVTVGPSLAIAAAAIQQEFFDAAVLSFSVPEEDRKQLARSLKEVQPKAKILMTYFDSVKNTELADALMPTTASAEELLRAVNHLLRERREERTG